MCGRDRPRADRGAQRAGELHAAGDFGFELVIGEEITTRRGHVLALFVTERIPALRPLEETIGRSTTRAGWRSRRTPGADPAERRAAQPAPHARPPDPRRAPRRDRALQPEPRRKDPARGAAALNDASSAPLASATRTPTSSRASAPADDVRRTYRRRVPCRDRRRSACARRRPHWSSIHNLDVYRRQLGAKAKHLGIPSGRARSNGDEGVGPTASAYRRACRNPLPPSSVRLRRSLPALP